MRPTTLALALALATAGGQAKAATFYFDAILAGANEAPPNASPATGFGRITFDDMAHTMRVNMRFSGLVAPNTAAHLHAATALPGTGTSPVATVTPTFTGFPSGTTSGSYSHLFDMTLASSYRAGYLTTFGGSTAAAEAGLLGAAKAGKSYLNLHSTAFPGGEIRGFLAPGVPEPATWALMMLGFGVAGTALRRRRVLAGVN